MQLELNRLASFGQHQQNPEDHLSSLTLARRGYFYNGRLPACYQCHVPLPTEENITADNLDDVHRRTSSNCPALETTVNVPLTYPGSPLTESDGTHQEESISAAYRRAWSRAESRGIFTSGSQVGTRENPDQERYRDEAARLGSFRGWPQEAPVQPDVLAAAGFFYTGTGDRVVCAFCGCGLSGWARGDDPLTEHERHYGDRNCSFQRLLRERRHEGQCHGSAQADIYSNDQRKSSLPMTTTQGERTAWSERPTINRSESPPPSPPRKLNLLTAEPSRQGNPKHPEFAEQLQRLRTYPSDAFPNGPRVESLASAGFFYEGPGDRLRCFHCAGILKNWKPVDVPLDEHEKWFPECQFLRSLRNDISLQLQSTAASVSVTAADFNPASVYAVEPREIKARMDSASVVTLLQMGFPRTLIRQAIEIRLRTTGDDFPSAESLLEAVFALQEKMPQEPSSSIPRDHKNDAPARQFTTSTTSHVIAAADKKEVDIPVVQLAEAENIAQENIVQENIAQENIAQENRQLREARSCKVCLDAEVSMVFLPCGHLVCCQSCSSTITVCPMCRVLIRGTVRVFLP